MLFLVFKELPLWQKLAFLVIYRLKLFDIHWMSLKVQEIRLMQT